MADATTVKGAPGIDPVPPTGAPARLPLGGGLVEHATLGPLTIESAAVLAELTVAYRHDGPGPGDAPQVVVVHALTGSADAAGDWWAPLIGPGRGFDTNRVGVLCANLLGGRYGTTGPMSRDPATGRPYGAAFPRVTPRDQASAIWRLLDALAIGEIALVTGGSLGGMVALEVALVRPAATRHVVPIAAPVATGPMAVAWNHIQLSLIEKLGDEGLALARQLAMTTYRCEADFDERFGRSMEADGRPAIVSYLEHQGAKLLDRFDGDTYRVLVQAMDDHDIGRGRGGIEAAFETLARGGTKVTGLGISGDLLYGPSQVHALVNAARTGGIEDAAYRELSSTKGHDAFLVEWEQLAAVFAEVLEGAAVRP